MMAEDQDNSVMGDPSPDSGGMYAQAGSDGAEEVPPDGSSEGDPPPHDAEKDSDGSTSDTTTAADAGSEGDPPPH